jgi:hypothetical protein
MAAKAQHKGKRSNSQMFHFNLPGSLFSSSAAAGPGALDGLAVRFNTPLVFYNQEFRFVMSA